VAARDPDGRAIEVVLKVRNPASRDGHFGATSLACELICAVLARSIGLNVPDYFIVEVPRSFPPNIPQESARRLLQTNQGLNFATRYIEDSMLWNPPSEAVGTLPEALEHVLAFDATVINGDRRFDNPNLLWDGGEEFYLIDHSCALPMPLWKDAEIDASPLFPETKTREHCTYPSLKGRRIAFVECLSQWAGRIDGSALAELRAFIPDSWEEKPRDLDRIFRFLLRRSFRFSDIQNELRRIVQ
jgi:HipA-like kinase